MKGGNWIVQWKAFEARKKKSFSCLENGSLGYGTVDLKWVGPWEYV